MWLVEFSLPCDCTAQHDPVCAINGRTYPNSCIARLVVLFISIIIRPIVIIIILSKNVFKVTLRLCPQAVARALQYKNIFAQVSWDTVYSISTLSLVYNIFSFFCQKWPPVRTKQASVYCTVTIGLMLVACLNVPEHQRRYVYLAPRQTLISSLVKFHKLIRKVERIASEEVVHALSLHSKCLPILLYGLEVYPLTKSDYKL